MPEIIFRLQGDCFAKKRLLMTCSLSMSLRGGCSPRRSNLPAIWGLLKSSRRFLAKPGISSDQPSGRCFMFQILVARNPRVARGLLRQGAAPNDIAGIVPKVFCKRRELFGPTFGTLLPPNERKCHFRLKSAMRCGFTRNDNNPPQGDDPLVMVRVYRNAQHRYRLKRPAEPESIPAG